MAMLKTLHYPLITITRWPIDYIRWAFLMVILSYPVPYYQTKRAIDTRSHCTSFQLSTRVCPQLQAVETQWRTIKIWPCFYMAVTFIFHVICSLVYVLHHSIDLSRFVQAHQSLAHSSASCFGQLSFSGLEKTFILVFSEYLQLMELM